MNPIKLFAFLDCFYQCLKDILVACGAGDVRKDEAQRLVALNLRDRSTRLAKSLVEEDVAFDINKLVSTNVDRNVRADTTTRAEINGEIKMQTKILPTNQCMGFAVKQMPI